MRIPLGGVRISMQANRGRTLEDLLEAVFRNAGPRAEVEMRRQYNKWVPIRGGMSFPQKGSPLDFVGVIGGKPIALECKENSTPRLSLHKARFPQKEIDALFRFTRAGGHAFVVAAFWNENLLAIYPFGDFYTRWLAYKKGKGMASVRTGDAEICIPVNSVLRIIDILRKLSQKKIDLDKAQ